MNKSLRKNVLLASAFALYGLMVMVVLVLLLDHGAEPGGQARKNPLAGFVSQSGILSAPGGMDRPDDLSMVLLPVGPDEAFLPGLVELWEVLLRSGETAEERTPGYGFDGIQAVRNIAEFSRGSMAELFLSGAPLQAFRRGESFLVLNNSGQIQIVDFSHPQQPELAGLLPYSRVKQMEMRGDTAYLLLGKPDATDSRLVIVDLHNPHQPREISVIEMPDYARAFYLLDRQLLTYHSFGSPERRWFVDLYDLTDDSQLVPLGRGNSVPLDNAVKYKDYLLVPDYRKGLRVVDIHDPLKPLTVASVEFPGVYKGLTLSGRTLFAMDGHSRMNVIDLQDPLHPVLVDVVEGANFTASFMRVDHFFYYFTQNGYLQTYDAHTFPALSSARVHEELVKRPGAAGLSPPGDLKGTPWDAVMDLLALSEQTQSIDQLQWHGFMVLLHEDGRVRFFRQESETSPKLEATLQFSPDQRWLAASDDRLYVGGKSVIRVVSQDDLGRFVTSGPIDFSVEEAWDGLVVEKALCVAAGRDGVVCFSIEDPDRLIRMPGWALPRQLASQVDVRQLDGAGDGRVVAAAGPAGLLRGLIDHHGQFHLDGFIDFVEPIYALAVFDPFCLVSTGRDVSVIDIRNHHSLQNLGEIAFRGVTRFAAVPPGFWAAYVPETGWSVSPAPHLLTSDESGRLQGLVPLTESSAPPGVRYHLKLFNGEGVADVPGEVAYSSASGDRATGAEYGLR